MDFKLANAKSLQWILILLIGVTLIVILLLSLFNLLVDLTPQRSNGFNISGEAQEIERAMFQTSQKSTFVIPKTRLIEVIQSPVSERNRERISRIEKYCEHLRQTNQLNKVSKLPKENGKVSFTQDTTLNKNYKLLWKRTPKCGYNTWMSHFRELGGAESKLFSTYPSRNHFLNTWKSLLDDGYVSFVFVRHPFDRLVSAYRNKLGDSKQNMTLFDKQVLRTEPQWVELSKRIAMWYGSKKRSRTCTFAEFVSALLDDRIWESHWNPISKMIYPCELKYTVIGKMETFEEDTKYIFQLKNVTTINTKKQLNRNKPIDTDTYFSTLTKKQVHGLYTAFQADFELFGYSLDKFAKYM